ncbi:MAG: SDR family NAD(P)-dependent oxidoreductase [Euzebyaceae bacterium]|nr:SDR family NAD(P)-dependent oxidoreductase [Euzebyaceae bacterium]
MQYDHERPRTALLAGGTGGLGAGVVEVLLDRGERVCVPYRTEANAERLRSAHGEAIRGGNLRLSQCDVSDRDQVAALLDVLGADWGPLWLACSLAGGWAGSVPVAEMDDFSLLDRMLTSNLRTAAVVAAEGLRHMGDYGGRVIVTGSRPVLRAVAGQAAYSAAKAGVLSLTATLAVELRGTGRTANAIVPATVDTPANRGAMPDAHHERWVPPRAVGKVIAWLTGADSWPVSGAVIPVYGDS